MWALVDDNQKRFINELSDHLNEQSFSTVNSLSKECNQYSLSRSESFTKLLIEEFDHGSD
ncbi:hypothetical protein XV74_07375 [Vibrio cholerae]|uniref:hypothetical protein n=1 Tax=Vibrio cholerae TaxID=666 RepID=UPI0006E7180B|nr:hypothetical protein [Vibrio cholerae]KQA39348.1 hypothetical protein XV74_07375 [Vibrio cholerae]KQA78807.1 hypothetical protein XV85_06225 [Vibrio cholerae]